MPNSSDEMSPARESQEVQDQVLQTEMSIESAQRGLVFPTFQESGDFTLHATLHAHSNETSTYHGQTSTDDNAVGLLRRTLQAPQQTSSSEGYVQYAGEQDLPSAGFDSSLHAHSNETRTYRGPTSPDDTEVRPLRPRYHRLRQALHASPQTSSDKEYVQSAGEQDLPSAGFDSTLHATLHARSNETSTYRGPISSDDNAVRLLRQTLQAPQHTSSDKGHVQSAGEQDSTSAGFDQQMTTDQEGTQQEGQTRPRKHKGQVRAWFQKFKNGLKKMKK